MSTKPSLGQDLKAEIETFLGYNSKDSKQGVEDGTITGGRNMALELPIGENTKSRINVRRGYTLTNTAPFSVDKCQGVKVYKRATEAFYRVMAVSAGILYEAQIVPPNFTMTGLTFTAVTGVIFSMTAKVVMKELNNLLFMVDGVHNLQYYTIVTSVDPLTLISTDTPTVNTITLPDAATPSTIWVHKNRLWYNSTVSNFKNVVGWSELNDPLQYRLPGAGGDAGIQYVRGSPDEVLEITAIGGFANGFLVHQNSRQFLFTTEGAPYNVGGDVTWNLKELKVSIGAISQQVVADLGEKLMYLTQRGVHDLSGMQALQADQIQTMDTLNAKPVSFEIDPDIFACAWDNAVAVYFKFYYILVLRQKSKVYNDTAFVYDSRRKVWLTPWDNFCFDCFDVANINGQDVCFAGSSKDGNVYTLFTSITDAGTKIEGWFDLNAVDFNERRTTKTFRKVFFRPFVQGDHGIYLSYSIDYAPFQYIDVEWKGRGAGGFILGSGGATLGTGVLGAGWMQNVLRFCSIGRRGVHCILRFSNNNPSNTGAKAWYGLDQAVMTGYQENEESREYA